MTSSTQIVGPGSGAAPGFDAAAIYGRSAVGANGRDDQGRTTGLVAQSRAGEAEALPGRRPPAPPGTAPSASDVVRLPGQEGLPEAGPRRPLIAGGAFTLAVAIGLSLDQRSRPEALEPATPSSTGEADTADDAEDEGAQGIDGLTEEERELVRELQQSDAEVRRHEAAHAAAGGQYAGPPTFTYQTGPDGKRYAIGGEVSIDTAPVKGDPEATIRKAQQIRAAANAPADPSSQDRRVAAQADSLRQQAQAELAAERREERQAEEAEAEATGAEVADAGPAEVERTAQQAVPPSGTGAPAASPAEGVAAEDDDSFGVERTGTGADGPADGDAGSEGFPAEPGDPDRADDTRRFAPGAFSGAAASYRGGPSSTPSLVSIAV